ncbi:MAG: GGDEF domain-containing protein [Bdellovibrionaceae bacterium]|nr:GGDEF domain-containing protein [Bdellovibrionales bacterium]MCB9085111.1 GGDEF domain-containing protein [Pseudobdellovibrionaceae bacterium]
MRQWIRKLIDQFDFEWGEQHTHEERAAPSINDDRATLLFVIDTFNKHLVEIENKPVRKVRQILDEFARELIDPAKIDSERVLFRFRQFFSSYRIDEYTYILKTFDEFRAIIWDFVDQLSEDLTEAQQADVEIKQSLHCLREAVEANSIDDLKRQSRAFIDNYIEYQTRRDSSRSRRMESLQKNLDVVKKKLVQANQNMATDHLTGAFNRRSFDEKLMEHWKLASISQKPISLMILDIDHFKRINDTFGHATGDYVLQEFVKILHELFARNSDFVARIGGEEFAIILPDYQLEHAIKKADSTLDRIRHDVLVQDGHEIRFTSSMGIAQLEPGESAEAWMKRADKALYHAKNTGRDRFSIANSDDSIHAA